VNDTSLYGRQYEFEKAYWGKPIPYNFVNLMQIGEISCESNFEIVEHLQICHEITYILSGEGFVYTDGKMVKASPGDVFLTRKDQMHAIKADEHCSLRYFYLAFEFNEGCNKEPYTALKNLFLMRNDLKEKDTLDISYPFNKAISELYYSGQFAHEMIGTYIDQILLLTCRLFTQKEVVKYLPIKSIRPVGYTVYAVIRYINENIMQITSIKSMAKELGYCEGYLSRIFKEKMGMTIQSYITMKKMEKAVEMIEQNHFTITEIALHLNYESVQSFSKSFKRTLGLSPAEYRKEFNKRELELEQVRQLDRVGNE